LDFFKSIPCLSKNSKNYLCKLHYGFEKKTYLRHQEVYTEGQPSTWIYLVKNGEFEMRKRIKPIGSSDFPNKPPTKVKAHMKPQSTYEAQSSLTRTAPAKKNKKSLLE